MTPGPDGTPASRREVLSRALVEEGDRLYALALRTTRDPDLAADAVQEAFASALEKADDFRGEARVGTWLHRIVFNKSIDLLRRRRRVRAAAGRRAGPPHLRGRASGARGRRGPRGRTTSSSTPRSSRPSNEALEELTPLQRAVFELKQAEGRPTAEVAEILDLTPGAVRVHLHRARLKLRARLSGHFHGPGAAAPADEAKP